MKVGIYTLGCKVNTYESEYVSHILEKAGYEIASFDDLCDIYIINTCTVTNTSDVKSRKIIKQAKKRNPNSCVVAMGCYIQAKKGNEVEGADILLGNKDKSKIVSLIEEFFNEKEQIKHIYDPLPNEFEDMYLESFQSRTRAFVKIQDGCENFCSYCIIPYVRGKCRSKNFDTVINEIKSLVKNGFSEIVLTGIHTGNYGVDINTTFAELLKEIIKIEGLKRIRISSIEITELNKEVLKIIKDSPIIVDHLHIPIQAASDKVLKAMNRKYNTKEYIEKINDIRTIRPNISITTDIIAGHPGEDDESFIKSIDILKQIHFTKLHVFPYSKRENTKSAEMEQVKEEVKKERVHQLLKLSRLFEQEYMEKFLNETKEVLFEVTKNNESIGHTDNYLQVKVNEEITSGSMLMVKIKKIEYPYCIGEVVHERL